MKETAIFRVSIVDTWSRRARAAGLVHVDGWANRSVFEGTAGAWARLAADLREIEADLARQIATAEGQRKRALLGERHSVRAVLARIPK